MLSHAILFFQSIEDRLDLQLFSLLGLSDPEEKSQAGAMGVPNL